MLKLSGRIRPWHCFRTLLLCLLFLPHIPFPAAAGVVRGSAAVQMTDPGAAGPAGMVSAGAAGSFETETAISAEASVSEVIGAVSAEAQAVDTENSGASSATLTLLAVGDNLAHVRVYEDAWQPDRGVYDFRSIYDPVRDFISSYDLAVVNQESIFVHDPALRSTFPAFGTPESMGDALADAGFDVVLSATNHSMDKGMTGILDTLNFWKTQHPEVRLLGLKDSPEAYEAIDYVEKNGIRLAMFNYTYGLNGYALPAGQGFRIPLLSARDKFLRDVRIAEGTADFTVCFLHIGEEYHFTPTAFQQEYVHALTDAGADLIICAHPHVLEPCGMVRTAGGNEALVYWSLGNFLSNQTRRETMLGGAASVTIRKTVENGVPVTRAADYSLIPTVCHFTGLLDRVYLLSDYNDDLASRHYISLTESPVTMAWLRELFRRITGREP